MCYNNITIKHKKEVCKMTTHELLDWLKVAVMYDPEAECTTRVEVVIKGRDILVYSLASGCLLTKFNKY